MISSGKKFKVGSTFQILLSYFFCVKHAIYCYEEIYGETNFNAKKLVK